MNFSHSTSRVVPRETACLRFVMFQPAFFKHRSGRQVGAGRRLVKSGEIIQFLQNLFGLILHRVLVGHSMIFSCVDIGLPAWTITVAMCRQRVQEIGME